MGDELGGFDFEKAVSKGWEKPNEESKETVKTPPTGQDFGLSEEEELFKTPKEPKPTFPVATPFNEELDKKTTAKELGEEEGKKRKAEETKTRKEIRSLRKRIKKETEDDLRLKPEKKLEEVKVATTIEEDKEPGDEEKTKKRTKIGRALAWIVTTGTALTWFIIGNRKKERQAEITPTATGLLGEGGTREDNSADYHLISIGRVGFSASGYSLAIDNPKVFINNDFMEMAAKFGDSFLLPPSYNDFGKKTGEINEAVVKDWAKALKLSETEVKENYLNWRDNPQEFRQVLLQHGASPIVIGFLQKADELKTQDVTPSTWDDRHQDLKNWVQQHPVSASETTAKVAEKTIVQETEASQQLDVMGAAETLAADKVHLTAMQQIQSSIGAAEILNRPSSGPEVALLAGMILLDAGVIHLRGIANESPSGMLRRATIKAWQRLRQLVSTTDATGVLKTEVLTQGEQVLGPETVARLENGRQMLNRLKANLPLSRNPNITATDKLNNPFDSDMQALIFTAGPGWFRDLSPGNPDYRAVKEFFACQTDAQLAKLANRRKLLIDSLRQALFKRKITNPALVALYKLAPGSEEQLQKWQRKFAPQTKV